MARDERRGGSGFESRNPHATFGQTYHSRGNGASRDVTPLTVSFTLAAILLLLFLLNPKITLFPFLRHTWPFQPVAPPTRPRDAADKESGIVIVRPYLFCSIELLDWIFGIHPVLVLLLLDLPDVGGFARFTRSYASLALTLLKIAGALIGWLGKATTKSLDNHLTLAFLFSSLRWD